MNYKKAARTGLKNAVDHFGTSACLKGVSLIDILRAWCCSRMLPSKYNVSGTKRTLFTLLAFDISHIEQFEPQTCR